jgi:hypothetical protein
MDRKEKELEENTQKCAFVVYDLFNSCLQTYARNALRSVYVVEITDKMTSF